MSTQTKPNGSPVGPVLGIVASALGLFFSGFSTHDYAAHLDRQLHGTHCSFVPGLLEADSGANACTAAMYSPYSAFLRERYWGGVPISLFALGAYAFFLSVSIYWVLGRDRAPRRLLQAFGLAAVFPALVSAVMFVISLTQLGAFCKLCVGLYVSSAVLLAAGIFALRDGFAATAEGAEKLPTTSWLFVPGLFAALGFFALLPAFVYVGALPSYDKYLLSCGKLTEKTEKHNALVHLATLHPLKPALFFDDPLCPTCKALHERFVDDGVLDRLDAQVALFPLDNDCNWMLDRALHPGACVLAKAVLCGDKVRKAREVLEWSFANQEALRDAGKAGKPILRARIKARFPDLDACIDAKETQQRLDQHLQYAVANKIAVSTPQLFLGEQRICDEDTDLGLKYTLSQLAPEVLR